MTGLNLRKDEKTIISMRPVIFASRNSPHDVFKLVERGFAVQNINIAGKSN
jgi:hypothetical protein